MQKESAINITNYCYFEKWAKLVLSYGKRSTPRHPEIFPGARGLFFLKQKSCPERASHRINRIMGVISFTRKVRHGREDESGRDEEGEDAS